MSTLTAPSKPINEMSADEIREFLAEKESKEQQERIEKRKAYESLREDTILGLIKDATHFKEALKAFKSKVFSDLETMYKLLQEHSQRHKNGMGSFTLENADSTMRVRYNRADSTTFDERATQAEKYILEFITSEFGDKDPRNKLITKLLERKKGKVDKDNVLQLAGMKDDFNNPNWHKGIDLYLESIVPSHTKYYAQFFIRDNVDSAWEAIVLDFARL